MATNADFKNHYFMRISLKCKKKKKNIFHLILLPLHTYVNRLAFKDQETLIIQFVKIY